MIYFMQSPTGGPIKIGYTADLRARHKALERHYGKKLEVLATAEGDRALEEIVHREFARLRIGRTEQFWVDDELLAFIRDPVASSDLLRKERWDSLLLRYEEDACALQVLAMIVRLAETDLPEVERVCRSVMTTTRIPSGATSPASESRTGSSGARTSNLSCCPCGRSSPSSRLGGTSICPSSTSI